MPKERVLIYENKKTQKYEIRFKKDFTYGVLDSFSVTNEQSLPRAYLVAHKFNSSPEYDTITFNIINRMRSLKKAQEIPEDFYPVTTTLLLPRIVQRKAEFDG